MYPVEIVCERFFRPPGIGLSVAVDADVDDVVLAALLLSFAAAVLVDWDAVVVGVAVVVGLGFSEGKMGGYSIGTSSPLINLDTEDPT